MKKLSVIAMLLAVGFFAGRHVQAQRTRSAAQDRVDALLYGLVEGQSQVALTEWAGGATAGVDMARFTDFCRESGLVKPDGWEVTAVKLQDDGRTVRVSLARANRTMELAVVEAEPIAVVR